MDQEIGLGELITQFIGYELEAVHTAIPAVVLRVNDEGRQSLVDVQPLVSILQRSGEVVSQPLEPCSLQYSFPYILRIQTYVCFLSL